MTVEASSKPNSTEKVTIVTKEVDDDVEMAEVEAVADVKSKNASPVAAVSGIVVKEDEADNAAEDQVDSVKPKTEEWSINRNDKS